MDNGTLFVDVVDMRSKTRNCILKKMMQAKDGLPEAQPDCRKKEKEELYPVNLLMTKI